MYKIYFLEPSHRKTSLKIKSSYLLDSVYLPKRVPSFVNGQTRLQKFSKTRKHYNHWSQFPQRQLEYACLARCPLKKKLDTVWTHSSAPRIPSKWQPTRTRIESVWDYDRACKNRVYSIHLKRTYASNGKWRITQHNYECHNVVWARKRHVWTMFGGSWT